MCPFFRKMTSLRFGLSHVKVSFCARDFFSAISSINFHFPAVNSLLRRNNSHILPLHAINKIELLQKPISTKFNPLCWRHLKLAENENFFQAFIYKSVPYVISPISATPAPFIFLIQPPEKKYIPHCSINKRGNLFRLRWGSDLMDVPAILSLNKSRLNLSGKWQTLGGSGIWRYLFASLRFGREKNSLPFWYRRGYMRSGMQLFIRRGRGSGGEILITEDKQWKLFFSGGRYANLEINRISYSKYFAFSWGILFALGCIFLKQYFTQYSIVFSVK